MSLHRRFSFLLSIFVVRLELNAGLPDLVRSSPWLTHRGLSVGPKLVSWGESAPLRFRGDIRDYPAWLVVPQQPLDMRDPFPDLDSSIRQHLEDWRFLSLPSSPSVDHPSVHLALPQTP